MSVHQGGKVCLLSQYDAELLVNRGIHPKCAEHRHVRRAIADEMVRDRALQRITLPGPQRYVWISSQFWQPVRGVLQLVRGDITGRKGKFKYGIPAGGARTQRQSVRTINAEREA